MLRNITIVFLATACAVSAFGTAALRSQTPSVHVTVAHAETLIVLHPTDWFAFPYHPDSVHIIPRSRIRAVTYAPIAVPPNGIDERWLVTVEVDAPGSWAYRLIGDDPHAVAHEIWNSVGGIVDLRHQAATPNQWEGE